ncbi:MAG: hypothetical protein H6839_09190 [Planctomycetes bacterium]|nr:hypothetical protein [Planctomycetota bacterium]
MATFVPSVKADPVKPGTRLRVVRGDRSEILDPMATSSGGDAEVISLIYESLVQRSDEFPMTWKPCLAESWKVSDDLKSWVFRLRSGVKFQDGTAMDAVAVKRSLDRAREPDGVTSGTMMPYAEEYFSVVESILAPDARTVVITLNTPDNRFISTVGLFCAAIISPTTLQALEKIKTPSDRTSWLSKHPCGTGPFRLDDPDDFGRDEIRLKAHDAYWGGKPTVDELVITTVLDAKSRSERLVEGTFDFVAGVPSTERAALAENEAVHLSVRPAENICYLGLNCDKEADRPTAELKLRKAIALAIRRDAIAEKLGEGVTPQYVLLPEVTPGHPKDYKPKGDELATDAALAESKKLVEQTGAPERPLRLVFPSVPRPYLGQPNTVADLIRQQLEAVGIEVKLQALSMREMVEAIEAGDYDLMLLGWMGETAQPDDFWTPLLSGPDGKPGWSNVAHFYEAEVESQLAKARAERDEGKRNAIFEGLEKSVHDKYRPIVPLYSASLAEAWLAAWQGIRIDAGGGWHFEKATHS